MKLKENIDYASFLLHARDCEGVILYHTSSGDILNLKSVLSEYVFLTVALTSDMLKNGYVELEKPEDFVCISDFLQE